MKRKYILIASLILAILTIGAASASEDIVSDDSLAVEEAVDEVAAEIDNSGSEEILAEDNGEETLSDEYEGNGIECYIDNDVDLEEYEDDYPTVVRFSSYSSSVTGTLKVSVDNSVKYTREISSTDYEEDGEVYAYLDSDDLEINSNGKYNVKVVLNDKIILESQVRVGSYSFDLRAYGDDEEGSRSYFEYGDTITFAVYLPDDVTNNKVKLTINGKSYDISLKDGYGHVDVSAAGWPIGSYKAVATYAGDSKYPSDSVEKTINIKPKVDCPGIISIGEQVFITISGPTGLKGNAVIEGYKYDGDEYVKFTTQNTNIVNGYGSYSLANLAEGDYKFNVKYQIGTYSDDVKCYVDVKKNTPGFDSSVSSTEIIVGNTITVKATGPSTAKDSVYIYLNDKQIKSSVFVNGQINEVVSGLTVGTQKINVYYDYGNDFYSKTYYINVKPVPKKDTIKLTLKNVKVKKSAKKLVLQATLKINGKAVKGKVIKFKFNKKTIKAKTNKKGVAKATIKKAVLKKLKVGKKITYTATYGKTVKKVTVKVKK